MEIRKIVMSFLAAVLSFCLFSCTGVNVPKDIGKDEGNSDTAGGAIVESLDEDGKINALMDKWESGELEKEDFGIYALVDYDCGINGEGHEGWLFNICNAAEDPEKIIAELEKVLPEDLLENFHKAKAVFDFEKDDYTEEETEIFDEADEYYYTHERQIVDILVGYYDSTH